MSTVYNVGKTDATPSGMTSLAQTLQAQRRPDGTPVYTPLTAVTLMVFYVFALQCVSTVAIVRRETNSWKWPFFQWLYMGALAWGLGLHHPLGRRIAWFAMKPAAKSRSRSRLEAAGLVQKTERKLLHWVVRGGILKSGKRQ